MLGQNLERRVSESTVSLLCPVDRGFNRSSYCSSATCLEEASPVPSPDAGPPAKKVNRCGQCKKRVGLTGELSIFGLLIAVGLANYRFID